MNRGSSRSIQQLDFERRWLLAKTTFSNVDEAEQNDLARKIECLELAIAATPVTDINDLTIKAKRLAAALHPSLEPIPEDSIEAILITAVLSGCRHLADSYEDGESSA